MLSRRSMIAGIFATASAPAIVRADSLMKIYVPPKRGIVTFTAYNNITRGIKDLLQNKKLSTTAV